ncbi:MAG: hypothetical protein IT349_18360 [Candidatus Eisenbacteria bacterium]|nr:hypothetical protein [Candidatus Eisenbacteria bacterium]MCC7144064.1 hypothetical protein [Candidatus Eisenbacteria bacterium]
MKRRTGGFTMIEAIVIVAVIAIIGGILTPMVIKEVAKAKISRSRADMEALATAFNEYYVDTSYWPEAANGSQNTQVDLVGFACMFTNAQNLVGWDGPYLERAVRQNNVQVVSYTANSTYYGTIDQWGRPFRVFYGAVGSGNGGAGGAIALVSGGPNKTINTNAANALSGVATSDDLVKIVSKRLR